MSLKRHNYAWIHALLILCFITAGISPACKFISGQMDFIEICTLNGIEKVAISTSEGDQKQVKTTNPCMFCVASHLHQGLPVLVEFSSAITLTFKTDYGFFQSASAASLYMNAYDARGPPFFS